jgi:hypothetical protein
MLKNQWGAPDRAGIRRISPRIRRNDMKKIISLIAIIALVLALFGGCGKTAPPNDSGSKGTQSQADGGNSSASGPSSGESEAEAAEEDDSEPESGESTGTYSDYALGTPAGSYARYIEAKSAAIELIYSKLDENPDAPWTISMAFLPISMVDLSLLPISVFSSDDPAVIEAAVSFFSYSDIDYKVDGNTYTFIYTDDEGGRITQVTKYDPDTDSLASSITDGAGNETMYFEYTKSGDGYAAQYFYPEADSGSTLIVSYFDKDVVAYGFKTDVAKPESIFGRSGFGVDFVKGCDPCFIFEKGTLTVVEEGVETVL